MPRRLPIRPAKIIGNVFVFIVLSYISATYYYFVYRLWGPRINTSYIAQVVLVFFHCLVLLLLWSFCQSMLTDPGQVPVFWGFHQGDSEQKRRRYCLMCNVFKPERCHHCSACNRCVLNMDHHCPWINNCIGFWNRKHFVLLLIYVFLTSYFTAIAIAYPFYQHIAERYNDFARGQWQWEEALDLFCMMSVIILDCFIAVLITMFLKYHIKLASENKTTIESLENKGKPFESKFDSGVMRNWYQIFGTNKFMWPFPMFLDSGKPLGDGIYWQRGLARDQEDDRPSNNTQGSSQVSEKDKEEDNENHKLDSKKGTMHDLFNQAHTQVRPGSPRMVDNQSFSKLPKEHAHQALGARFQGLSSPKQVVHKKDDNNVLTVNQPSGRANKQQLQNIVQAPNTDNQETYRVGSKPMPVKK